MRLVTGLAVMLVNVIVRVETVPSNAAAGVKPFPTVIELATTTLLLPVEPPLLEIAPAPPSLLTTPPAAMVLFNVVPITAPGGVIA